MTDQFPNPSGVPDPPRRRRGRPRKNPEGPGSEYVRARQEEAAAETVPPLDKTPDVPPEFLETASGVTVRARKGRWYFARQMHRLNKAQDEALERGEGGIRGYDASLKGIMYEASLHGVTAESVIDSRTDEELRYAAIRLLAEKGGDICEVVEPMIDALERLFDDVEVLCSATSEDDRRQMLNEGGTLERAAKLGKRLRSLLKRLRAIRERVRRPSIPGPRTRRVEREVEEAAHPLRFMAYCMRAGGSDSPIDEDGNRDKSPPRLLSFRDHHAHLAWVAWQVINRKTIWKDGGFRECQYEGGINVIPPGHGKTTFASGFLGTQFCLNPLLRVLFGHSQEDQACATLRYVANFFTTDNAMGRRREAVFPGLWLDRKSDHEFRIHSQDPNRQPSMRAYGMKAQVGGSDADVVILDDPVDPKEREQPEERRRKNLLVGEWMHRLRGTRAYHMTYTTLWHPDDANMTRIRKVLERKSWVKALILSCGGPEDRPGKAAWQSLWPEVWPPSRLRQRYADDPSLYMATFCSDPRPESHQIIRKLRYYDPNADDHAEFLRTALFHLSLDPAATNREHSDMSGLVYAACGEVVGPGKGGEIITERRLRVIEPARFKATLHELKDRLANYILSRRVDRVHVETQAAFVALPEMLRREYDIDCIPHNVGKKSKEIRLRSAGILIDDTRPTPDSCGAVVEFPGVVVHGKETVQPDPSYAWFYEQILRFGSVKQDDCVDSLSQLVNHLARTGDLEAGAGWVTQRVRAKVVQSEWERRLNSMYGDAERKRTAPAEQEDAEFAAGMLEQQS